MRCRRVKGYRDHCILSVTGLGCAAIALFPVIAEAQQPEDLSARQSVLEEIIVTARRRSETLQDVPGAVSAFSDTLIGDLQADDISGLQYAVPNLYLEEGDASNAVIFLRGVGQNDSLAFVESGVAVYVDDVFISRTQAAFLDLFDVERVEVLRGPQGTLYGRNSPGGAIKFISTAPPDEFEADFEIGGGRFEFLTLKGRVGGPIIQDKLHAKLAVALTNHDGINRNSFTGRRDGDTESFAWRGALTFAPSDDLALTLTADGKLDRPDTSKSPIRETPLLAFPDAFTAPDVPVILPPNDDPFVVDTNANGLNDLTSFGFTLKADWQISQDWSLESISAYREMDFDLVLDTDGSPLPVLDISLFQDQWQVSQELRASYDNGKGFTFTGGVFYFHDSDLTLSGFDAQAGALPAFGLPLALFSPNSQLADTDQRTDSIAVFGQSTIDLTDTLSLELGLRYTYDEKSSRRRFELFAPDIRVAQDFPPFLAGFGTPLNTISGKEDWDALTPKIALSYAPRDTLLYYASVSRGFKSGGFDGRGSTEFEFQPFSPEKVWTFEGGVKSSWLDNRLAVNGTYFYSRYRDLQVTSFGRDAETGFFQSLFSNAAAARIQGVEFELAARPIDRLSINATVGFMDAEYKEFITLVNGVPEDVSDRDLINSPKWNASLGATWEQPVGNGLLGVFHVDAAYRGDVANEITDSPILRQDEYILLNAFISVKSDDAGWELRAGGKNITGREIRVQGFNLAEFPGVETAFFSNRRSWDLRLFYHF
ncbi:TonB-dependent receptor [Iodidimonas gelatinilytica]|uniref:TonB-dependent receptor n=1 Tax=Iodidimonas gelatinilytica TaxID=1236966 RepID=A0A5A7MU26_9PROT|nr:TonB-dependent receptor [Iodidimonas gelatinilytica]GEQ99134.1 TonB-dependent receptor [Iodidimonas gelatinilytica]